MQSVLLFLSGMLLGALLSRWAMLAAHRDASLLHIPPERYAPARRAAVQHVRAHGTVNIKQLELMLCLNKAAVLECADCMVRDGTLRRHGHRGEGEFYTLC